MIEVKYLKIDAETATQRLDNYLLRILKGVPKSHIYRIIRAGEVRVNKKRAKPDLKLNFGDLVRIPPVRTLPPKNHSVNEQFAAKLLKCIIYEDENFIVVNKPFGLAVHGGSGLSLGLIEALRTTRTDLRYLELIHRIDRETSGCILVAKKRSALRKIQASFALKEVKKIYLAILQGVWQNSNTVAVNIPLQKNVLKSGERMVVVSSAGKPSQSNFKFLENYQDSCLVEVAPVTGRTHQIRVHSAYLKHPILGDEKYGGQVARRLYLHAYKISFALDDKQYNFVAELDGIFNEAICKKNMI
jgi:23S rRNA pseudouridine955/2504/2580 synthase